MRKDRPDSPLAALTDAQQDELFAVVNAGSYGRAREWALETFGVETSVAALSRWRSRQASRRLQRQLRQSVEASAAFDAKVDQEVLDRRMGNALKSAFFAAVSSGNADAIIDFAQTAMEHNRGERAKVELQIRRQAQQTRQQALDLLREKFEASEARLAAARDAVNRLNQSGGLTPEARAEIEKAMGLL
jgi:BMFP domain-containing protein YqiC